MNDFTKEEMKAIKRLKRAFESLPDSVRCYVVDHDMSACKLGVGCDELYEPITTGVHNGCYLHHLHDDCDFGRDS